MSTRRQSLARHPIVRILIIWAFEVVGLVIMALLLDGLQIDRLGTAIVAVAIIGLLNALLWPILSRILLPFAVFTGGLLFLVLNGVIIWLASELIDGFQANSLWTAMVTALGITAINIILRILFTIDDEGSYYRNVIARRMRKQGKDEETDVPGVFFLEIDSLSKPVLEKAMALGYAPTMKRWLDEGSHRLVGWVSASQVQAFNAESAPVLVGPTPIPPTPAPIPQPKPTRTPRPTKTPKAKVRFAADRKKINAGECAVLVWQVKNVRGVWVYPKGFSYKDFPVTGEGAQQVCPEQTTTYRLRAINADGKKIIKEVKIKVNKPVAVQLPS